MLSDGDQHLILPGGTLAQDLRKLAMEELKTSQILVGSREHPVQVEFFALDLKKDKAAVAKLKKVVSRHWRRVINEFELARDDAADVLDDTLNGPANAIESWVALRRFLSNALNPEILRKTKRSILLFRHEDANAPEMSDERRAA